MLGAKDIAVEIGDPPPSVRRDVEVAHGALDMRRYAAPIKLRILIGEIGRRNIAELLIPSDFLELVIKRIGFAQILRIAKLADEIGGAYQHALFAVAVVGAMTRALDGIGDTGGVEPFALATRSITNSFDRSTR